MGYSPSMELGFYLLQDIDPDVADKQVQIQEQSREPLLLSEDTKRLTDGCTLHLIPSGRTQKDPDRYDITLEDSSGTCYHLTRNQAYLPGINARKIFARIDSEAEFQIVLEEYWAMMKRVSEKQREMEK